MINKILIFIFFIVLAGACNFKKENKPVKFGEYILSKDSSKRIALSNQLKEISGLAYLNGNLLAHNDELGIIYKLNIDDGEIISSYSLGDKKVRKDFEGIAVKEDSIFLITSGGSIYVWQLGSDANDFRIIETGLKEKNNIEGLCYDQKTNSLLIACKDFPGNNFKVFKAIYSFNLQTEKLILKPRFLLSLDEINSKIRIKNFSPSGIEINPITGNCFIISSKDKAIIEIDDEGKIINYAALPRFHNQPEGITFTPNGDLVISDEGNPGAAAITIYKLIK
ncbi:MAG: SdiA-regulated domain-containing protein [Ignavibacteriaceae bacterium]